MKQRKITEEIGNDYIKALSDMGPHRLCDKIVERALDSKDDILYPELDILEFAEAFFALHRRTENYKYSEVGQIVRRAAHIVYRESLKNDKNKTPNKERFLTLVAKK